VREKEESARQNRKQHRNSLQNLPVIHPPCEANITAIKTLPESHDADELSHKKDLRKVAVALLVSPGRSDTNVKAVDCSDDDRNT